MVEQPMALSNWLPNRISPDPRYECPLCSLSFDAERSNCPACGYTDLRQTR